MLKSRKLLLRCMQRTSWKISQQMLICVCSSVKIVGFVAKNSICSSFFRSSCQHCWAAATLSVTFRSRQTKDTRYTWKAIAQSFWQRMQTGQHFIKILHGHLLLGQQMVLTLDIVQSRQYKVRQTLLSCHSYTTAVNTAFFSVKYR